MSKLADIFRPKDSEIGGVTAIDGVVVPMPLPAARANGVGHRAISQFVEEVEEKDEPLEESLFEPSLEPAPAPEVSSEGDLHRSEESEALHRLLVNTHRKIGDLDALKSALDDMVLPFRGAMRALEQERALSAHLSRQLNEKSAACDKLRDELAHADNKVRLLDLEAEDLRDALGEARESGRAVENARLLLSEELKRRDARVAALEHEIEQDAMQHRNLGENYRGLQEQVLQGEKRAAELNDAVADAERRCEALKQDKRALWRSAEQAREDIERLNRHLADGVSALKAMRADLGKAEARHVEACAERNRLADLVEELRAQRQAERQNFDGQVETLESRLAATERQLAEMRQRLIERTEEARAFICKAAEATMARATAERRLAALQVSRGLRGSSDEDPAEARTALSEFLRALNLKSREMALANAAEKMSLLSERTGQSANGHAAERGRVRADTDKRAADLMAALQDDPGQRAEIEKALEAARQANARLESEVESLTAELRSPAREPVGTARPKTRAASIGTGGLNYEAGLVAQFRPSKEDDGPVRSAS